MKRREFIIVIGGCGQEPRRLQAPIMAAEGSLRRDMNFSAERIV